MPTPETEPSLWSPRSLPPDMRSQFEKMATPAHLAVTATADLPPDAQLRRFAHLDYINTRLVAACTAACQSFLDIEVSVRHGKSFLCSGFLPVWYLGLFPDRRVILLSYNEDKAAEWGAFTRDVMAEWGPSLFGIQVDTKTASRTLWKLKAHRGEVLAAGMDGTVTGKGGDLIVIDDPIKNREQADSEAQRTKMVSSYYSNIRTRLPPWGTIVLAMARWHEADLAGSVCHLDRPSGDKWERIRFPAIAEAPKGADVEEWRDELGRKEGDALWPEVWPINVLEDVRDATMEDDPQTWHSLYQQNPTAKEGKTFKIAKWVVVPHVDRSKLRLVRFWDLAATDSKSADWTVGGLIGMDPDGRTYVLDMQRFRCGPGELEERIAAVAEVDGVEVPIRLEQEKAGAGKIVTHQFVRLLTGYDIDGKRPEGDKTVRANPVAAQQNKGRVILVLPAGGSETGGEWLDLLIEEGRVFPNGRHDDMIDTLSGGFEFLAGVGPTEMETERQFETPLEQMYQQSRSGHGMSGAGLIAHTNSLLLRR